MVLSCFFPTVQQAFAVSMVTLVPCLLLRFIVLCSGWQSRVVLNVLATVFGVLVLWWFYGPDVIYFTLLCLMIYVLLLVLPPWVIQGQRGTLVTITCVGFILFWYREHVFVVKYLVGAVHVFVVY